MASARGWSLAACGPNSLAVGLSVAEAFTPLNHRIAGKTARPIGLPGVMLALLLLGPLGLYWWILQAHDGVRPG